MAIFQTKEKDGTMWVRVSGYLTKDPKTFDKTIIFSVCYDKKKYMDVQVWRSNEDLGMLASCLERHDYVAVDGKLDGYTGKDGTQRWKVVADFVSVVGANATSGKENARTERATPPPQEAPGAKLEEVEDDGELPF